MGYLLRFLAAVFGMFNDICSVESCKVLAAGKLQPFYNGKSGSCVE